ncbi:MAG: dihydroorotate dehydrogenase [Candidatus Omnitrophica bacterium]|nr:dihydroorotate dehydrogenase [Candidatus Omnitrophota bacterium]
MDLIIKIKNITFKNPIWVASGTFGCGEEFQDFVDLEKVGAIVTKTVTARAREGNPPPRIVETASGLLNSIGLENKGIDFFLKEQYPFLKKIKTRKVVSVSASSVKEFEKCIEKIYEKEDPDAVELNLSCPNVKHSGTKYNLLAQDAKATAKVVRAAKKKTKKLLIVKLTPNVTDIAGIAIAAEASGADAVALVNTYPGMAIDAEAMKPVLGNVVGGLSGPAIKPMALKAVRDVYKNVKIPVIGMGGIMTGIDVAEFMLAGARAVQLGTTNLVDPSSYERILGEFKAYLKRKKIKKAASLVGKLG